jgi:hypothetical protein
MEHLSIEDPPPLGAGQPQNAEAILPGPPQVPQLPPQMFTTAAQLLDLTDSKFSRALTDLNFS